MKAVVRRPAVSLGFFRQPESQVEVAPGPLSLGHARLRSPRPQHREGSEGRGWSSGAGGVGVLPIIETWGTPRPLQPRTGPIGSGGTAVTNLLPLSSLSCLSVSSSWLSLCMWLPVLFTLPASAGRWGMSLKGYGSTLCHQAFVLLLLDHPPSVPGRGVSGPLAHPHRPPMKLPCHPEAPTSPP